MNQKLDTDFVFGFAGGCQQMATHFVAAEKTKISYNVKSIQILNKIKDKIKKIQNSYFGMIPGISLANVGTNPRNMPRNPSFLMISRVIVHGPILFVFSLAFV